MSIREKKTPDMIHEMVPEDRMRSHFYALLARLLAGRPDEPLIHLLRKIPDDISGGRMASAWTELREAALIADLDTEAAEYDRMFCGIDGCRVLPYASWYRTGYLSGAPLVKIRADLNRLGFEKAADTVEPEDHAAALCETMALLCRDSRHAACEQAAFFGRHLAPWLENFFFDLIEAAETNFYKAAGNIGRMFFQVEKEYLGCSPEPSIPGDHKVNVTWQR